MKPAVSERWLLLLAGTLWAAVGVMLCRLAYRWLAADSWGHAVLWAAVGILLGLVGYRFSFGAIARKNIRRILAFSEKRCLFAFQAWRSYLIIAFMIALGLSLRHSPFPKQYLAAIYIAVGVALLLSSLIYYGLLWRVVIRKQPPPHC